MFTGRRKIWVLLAVALLVGMFLAVRPSSHEPSYGGRPLSEWLLRYGTTPGLPLVVGNPSETDQAIRHMGTNAIPCLLKYIQDDSPAWQKKPMVDINEFSRRLRLGWRWTDHRAVRASGAMVALQVLGPSAEGAIPELTRLMYQTNSRATRDRAACALPFLGPKSVAPLLAVLTNQQAEVRPVVAHSLHPLGTNARPLIPTLIQCLKDRDLIVSEGAADALASFKIEPSMVVPALMDSLQDPRASFRSVAALSLGEFGLDALPALPALSNLLNDPDPKVRRRATTAVARLREAARSASAH